MKDYTKTQTSPAAGTGTAERPQKAEKAKGRGTGLVVAFLVGIIISIGLYMILLNVEKKMMSEYESKTVWVSVSEIPKNEVITEENCAQYFVQKDIDATILSENVITDIESVYGLATSLIVDPGVAVTENMFHDIYTDIESLNDPREIGFGVEGLTNIVSGVVRKGDKVDIYFIKNEDEETKDMTAVEKAAWIEKNKVKPTYENVTVYRAFSSDGVEIDNSDTATSCMRINIVVESDTASDIYKELEDCTVYISKVVD